MPLEKYKENLENIVDHIRAVGCENVILITPPPVWEEARLQALREVAKERICDCILAEQEL